MTVVLRSLSNIPVASLFPHLTGLLTEGAHLHGDGPVSQSGRLSLRPPAAWNSTEDTHQRNYTSYTPENFTDNPYSLLCNDRHSAGTESSSLNLSSEWQGRGLWESKRPSSNFQTQEKACCQTQNQLHASLIEIFMDTKNALNIQELFLF